MEKEDVVKCMWTLKDNLGVLKICGVELVAAGYIYHVLINNRVNYTPILSKILELHSIPLLC